MLKSEKRKEQRAKSKKVRRCEDKKFGMPENLRPLVASGAAVGG